MPAENANTASLVMREAQPHRAAGGGRVVHAHEAPAEAPAPQGAHADEAQGQDHGEEHVEGAIGGEAHAEDVGASDRHRAADAHDRARLEEHVVHEHGEGQGGQGQVQAPEAQHRQRQHGADPGAHADRGQQSQDRAPAVDGSASSPRRCPRNVNWHSETCPA